MPKQKKIATNLDDQISLNPLPKMAVRKHQKKNVRQSAKEKTINYRDPAPSHPHGGRAQAPAQEESINPLAGILQETHETLTDSADTGETVPKVAVRKHHLAYENPAAGIWLYHDNCLTVLDAIAAKYPEGRFDMIFADPPYFLSNGGITCHAGKMVKVDKGDWDKSRGWEWNHEFNTEWLKRCQKVLKPNGTIWVTGTHHVIFSVGFAMQQLGYKILNDIAWEKPNPPPNLSCRYFTHSTETIIWAAKNEKSKHLFNYQEMRKVTGKQMKTVWRQKDFLDLDPADAPDQNPRPASENPDAALEPIWTMTAPGGAEKTHGKHPTQKPTALVERCLLASTNPGDSVLDPFLGGGTTLVASIRLARQFTGMEVNQDYLTIAYDRADAELVAALVRSLQVRMEISLYLQNDLDPSGRSMDRIRWMKDGEPKADCIFHETKFVFLSCAVVSEASVVHTTVDVSLQEAWAKTPNGKKRETTHVVRCETEILRVTAN